MIATECPKPESLQAYSLGRLPNDASEEISAHLHQCEQCAAELETFDDREDTLIGQLRTSADESFADEPGLDAALERATRMSGLMVERTSSFVRQTLGEYDLLEEVGRGGMGRVYRARHTKLGRTVAVKVLPSSRLDAASAARFRREVLAIGGLNHPNIVHAYDAREIDGVPVLVMELVEGMDLGELARRLGPLRVADACELVRQAALALQYAHEHGLVHRDVKPSNLMLDRLGRVRLLDLGLARLGEGSAGESVTATGHAMGTADYIAPEQVANSRSADIRSDIYSLGCTLYRLIVGETPFSGRHFAGTMDKLYAHVHRPFPSIRQHVPEVPRPLETILAKMTAKDPAQRFQTPGALAEALQPLAAQSDVIGLVDLAERTPRPDRDDSQDLDLRPQPLVKSQLHGPRSRWPFVVALALGMIACGFAAGVGITVYRDGKATRIEVPDGAAVKVNESGEVDVHLDDSAVAATDAAAGGTRPVIIEETPAIRNSDAIRSVVERLEREGIAWRGEVERMGKPVAFEAIISLHRPVPQEQISKLISTLLEFSIQRIVFNDAQGGENALSVIVVCPADVPWRTVHSITERLKKLDDVGFDVRVAGSNAPVTPTFNIPSSVRTTPAPTTPAPATRAIAQVPARRLWNEYGVTPAPVNELTAKLLEWVGLHVSPIDQSELRGEDVLSEFSGGLKVTFSRYHGPNDIIESDVIVGLSGVAVRSLAELDTAVATAISSFADSDSKDLQFILLRSGKAVSIRVPVERRVRESLLRMLRQSGETISIAEPNLEDIWPDHLPQPKEPEGDSKRSDPARPPQPTGDSRQPD